MSTKHPPYFYDKEIKRLSCYTYYDLVTTLSFIKNKGKDIDVNGTGFLPAYSIKYTDGSYKLYYSWMYLFEQLEEDFGISVDLQRCGGANSTYFLGFKEDIDIDTLYKQSKGKSNDNVSPSSTIDESPDPVSTGEEDTTEDDSSTSSVDFITDITKFGGELTTTHDDGTPIGFPMTGVSTNSSEGEGTPLTDETFNDMFSDKSDDKVEVDYEYLQSLYDENKVRASKDALEKVVIERHAIDLRKNQSFDKMIEQLKEEMAK